MISTTVWPSSWNSRSFRSTTVWPRWMSGVVGSTPSFTRSGRPFASWRSSSPSGSASTAFRVRKRAVARGDPSGPTPAATDGESVMGPMLECCPCPAPRLAVRTGAVQLPFAVDTRTGAGRPSPWGAHVMQEPQTPTISHPAPTGTEPFPRSNGVPARTNGAGPPPRKPKLKKLRLALVLSGLSALALISTLFGMLMAVASDLPSLENRAQYDRAENSVLYADSWGCKVLEKSPCQQIAKLTGNQN